jgi:hypothetical protein
MIVMIVMMKISLLGQLGLWAPYSGARDVFASTAYVLERDYGIGWNGAVLVTVILE